MDTRTIFPLTSTYLGPACPNADTIAEFVERVCEAHARGDIPCRAARDLARYEALLADLPDGRPAIGALPRDDEPIVLAPHVRVLVYGAGLPEMVAALREGKSPSPRPSRGTLVLWRGGEMLLPREEGWFLEAFREPSPPAELLHDDDARSRLARLWGAGILVRP